MPYHSPRGSWLEPVKTAKTWPAPQKRVLTPFSGGGARCFSVKAVDRGCALGGECALEDSIPLLAAISSRAIWVAPMKCLLFVLAAFSCVTAVAADDHLVFAHRGASGYLPEHSLPAKAMAFAQGADYLEQDVVLTKDSVPLVLHDIHLDSITDVAEKFPQRCRKDGRYYVIDFTLAEIRQLTASQRFDHKTNQPAHPGRFPLDGYTYQLHTLEEEIRFIQGLNTSTGRDVGLFTEVKKPTFHEHEGYDIAKLVHQVLRRYGYGEDRESRCRVQCFEKSTLQRFRDEFGWRGQLVMIFSGGRSAPDGTDYDLLATPAGLQSLTRVVDCVFPNLPRVVQWDTAGQPVCSQFVQNAHQAGLRVITGVIRKDALPDHCPSVEALHIALIELAQVDDLCTDFPDLSTQWLHQRRTQP